MLVKKIFWKLIVDHYNSLKNRIKHVWVTGGETKPKGEKTKS